MPARDIMPWISPMGGTCEVRWGQMTSGEDFEVGEPISLVDAGTYTEPTQDAAPNTVAQFDTGGSCVGGIAAIGPGDGNINPATGNAFTALDDIAYWPFGQATQFITKNFFAAAAGAAAVPIQTDVGEPYQMTYSTTAAAPIGWGLEKTVAVVGVDVMCVVLEVLDAEKRPIRVSGAAGVYVVFEVRQPGLEKVT
jgi:hypothetical protein